MTSLTFTEPVGAELDGEDVGTVVSGEVDGADAVDDDGRVADDDGADGGDAVDPALPHPAHNKAVAARNLTAEWTVMNAPSPTAAGALS